MVWDSPIGDIRHRGGRHKCVAFGRSDERNTKKIKRQSGDWYRRASWTDGRKPIVIISKNHTDNQWKPRPGPSIPIPRRKSDPNPIILDKYPPPHHTRIHLVGGYRAGPLERRVCPYQHMELMIVAHRLNRVYGGICGLFGRISSLCQKGSGQSASFSSLPCASLFCLRT
jgi:hypothetical protein